MTRNVLWICSYPKSGNTWVHEVLRTAGKKWGFPRGSMDIYDMQSSGQRPEICVPVLKSVSSEPCYVLKTHSPFKNNGAIHSFADMPLETVGFIYLYRNPLDLLLSYINFTRIEYSFNSTNDGYKSALFHALLGMTEPIDSQDWVRYTLDSIPQRNLDHALDVFSERGLTIPTCLPSISWAQHVRGWIDASDKFPSVVLRYEDCIEDPAKFLAMAKFFEFGPRDIVLALRSVEGRSKQVPIAGSESERIFFNKMRPYYFSDYFSAAALQRFYQANGSCLTEFGYGDIWSRSA